MHTTDKRILEFSVNPASAYDLGQCPLPHIDDVAIRMIAYADSMFHGSQTSAGGHKLMKLKSTLQNDAAMIETGQFNISPVLLAMQQYFEKYEGRIYWCACGCGRANRSRAWR